MAKGEAIAKIAPLRIGDEIGEARLQGLIVSILSRSLVPLDKTAIAAVMALENSAGIGLGIAANVLNGNCRVEIQDPTLDALDVDAYRFHVNPAVQEN